MTSTSTSTSTADFDIDSWVEEPFDEAPGATLARVTVTKTFRGDIEGTSVAHLLTGVTEVEGSAGYVGLERMAVSVAGRSGTFVLQHSATSTASDGQLDLAIIVDSGTDQLEGISGTAQIDRGPNGEHSLTLDYDLP